MQEFSSLNVWISKVGAKACLFLQILTTARQHHFITLTVWSWWSCYTSCHNIISLSKLSLPLSAIKTITFLQFEWFHGNSTEFSVPYNRNQKRRDFQFVSFPLCFSLFGLCFKSCNNCMLKFVAQLIRLHLIGHAIWIIEIGNTVTDDDKSFSTIQ